MYHYLDHYQTSHWLLLSPSLPLHAFLFIANFGFCLLLDFHIFCQFQYWMFQILFLNFKAPSGRMFIFILEDSAEEVCHLREVLELKAIYTSIYICHLNRQF